MTEQVPPTTPESMGRGEESSIPEAETTSSGVPAVDTVLADLDRVDAAPFEQHLAMFEHAHESLRAALDAPSVDRSDPSA